MKLRIIIDNMNHEIDSTDPEILAKWILEIIARVPWSPATYAYFQAFPTFLYNQKTHEWKADWVTDSRVIGVPEPFKTPKQLWEALGDQLERAEQYK